MANFLNVFKMAMGESQTDEIDELSGGTYWTAWILFLFLAFFTTIVYMNILIAVVSDEFEKVYDSRHDALYQIRLPYIIKYW
jgi:dolichol kinase